TCDQAQFDGVLATGENDRDGCRGRLRGERSRVTTSTNHCDLSAHEFARERRQSIHSTFCPAVFNADIAVLDIACLNEALPERGNGIFECSGRSAVEEPDNRHRRLLRPRRERPRSQRAAEKRDELAPLHSITSSARASSVGGISRPSAFAVLRLMTSSYLVGACTGRSAGFSPLRIRST